VSLNLLATRSAAREGYPLGVDVIDWGAAQRIGELVAGSPPYGGVRTASIEPLAYDFARRVSAYSGLELPPELPPVEAVDRPAWIAANLTSIRPLLGLLTERMDDGTGPLAGPLRSATGFLLGAQVGALTGALSQRVLGQYDVALLDASVPPRLLLLAPNLALTARNMNVDRDELVLWVTIHEVTHAVQFSGAPWLRDHLGGMVRDLIDGLKVAMPGQSAPPTEHGPPSDLSSQARAPENGVGDRRGVAGGPAGAGHRGAPAGPSRRPKLPDPGELREMVERARRGELLRLTLGEERWQLVERMQAAMSLIEGHAEHTMDAVGAEVLPSLPALRAAMNRRRRDRGLPWRVLERLLGLELKLRQYEVGRRFCAAVVSEGGPQALARAWSGPEALPSAAELHEPAKWLARTRQPTGTGT
jgi:uncharacterized protein (DUF2342 family)